MAKKKYASPKYDPDFHRLIKLKAFQEDKTITAWTREIAKKYKDEEIENVFAKKRIRL